MTVATNLVPIFASAAVAVAAALATLYPAVRGLRLKRSEEQRLVETADAERTVALLGLFGTLVSRANARGPFLVAPELAVAVAQPGSLLQPASHDDLKRLLTACSVQQPVGFVEQLASIAIIAELGRRHDVMRELAIQALDGLVSGYLGGGADEQQVAAAAKQGLERINAQ